MLLEMDSSKTLWNILEKANSNFPEDVVHQRHIQGSIPKLQILIYINIDLTKAATIILRNRRLQFF